MGEEVSCCRRYEIWCLFVRVSKVKQERQRWLRSARAQYYGEKLVDRTKVL